MKAIEEIYLELKSIADEVDPMEAFIKIEILNDELGSQYYGNWGAEIMNGLYDENLYYISKNHKEKVETLRNDGLLNDYIRAKSVLSERIVEFLSPHLPLGPNVVHSMIIKFSAQTFDIESVDHRLVDAAEYFQVPDALNRYGHVEIDTRSYDGINDISPNSIEYYWCRANKY
jgi:hypothetical protein